jgi:hypothetical protein
MTSFASKLGFEGGDHLNKMQQLTGLPASPHVLAFCGTFSPCARHQNLRKLQFRATVTDSSLVVQLSSLHLVAGSILASCRSSDAVVYPHEVKFEAYHLLLWRRLANEHESLSVGRRFHAVASATARPKTPIIQGARRKVQPNRAQLLVDFQKISGY